MIQTYKVFLFVVGALTVFRAVHNFRFGRHLNWRLMGGFTYLAAGIWSLTYMMEISAGTVEGIAFWRKIGFLGVGTLAPSWYAFVATYTGQSGPLGRRWKTILAITTTATLFIVWTNDFHHLFWLDYSVRQENGLLLRQFAFGPLGIAHIVNTLFLMYASLSQLARFMRQTSSLHRSQILFVALTGAATILPAIHDTLRTPPLRGIDLTPIGIALASGLIFAAINRHKFGSIIPVARTVVLENLEEGILVLDTKNQIVDMNNRLSGLLEQKLAALIGLPLAIAWPELNDILEPVATDRPSELEVELAMADHLRDYSLRISPLVDANGRNLGRVLVLQDITARKQAQRLLLHQAMHDDLTGLASRDLLEERLELALQRAKRHTDFQFAVLFLDLDRFKLVNDSLGHAAGDQLLKEVADRITTCVRDLDTVARLGGDEFVLLLEGVEGLQDATRVAARVQTLLSEPFHLPGREVFSSASIGIVLASRAYKSADAILRDADSAMYKAKATGKARFQVFDPTMHAEVLADLELERKLRLALESNQFELRFQPIVALDNHSVQGFEALMHWPDQPDLTLAEHILHSVEESGLSMPIGTWMLDNACRQLKSWHRQGGEAAELMLCINISQRQLLDPQFIRRIEDALIKDDLKPDSLIVEINEAALLAEDTTNILHDLRASGVKILVDNFGMGPASLVELHAMPVDAIKLDGSFLSSFEDDWVAGKIVAAVIEVAEAIGLDVIADGVETEQQLSLLRQIGCPQAQGAFLGKPAPASHYTPALHGGVLPTVDLANKKIS